jgi:RNA polymerase sigma factor (sigma-70 family)
MAVRAEGSFESPHSFSTMALGVLRLAEVVLERLTGHLADLVVGVRCCDDGAMTELYTLVSKAVHGVFLRGLGPHDADDMVHDCYLAVVRSLRRSGLRDPERLLGFVRAIARIQICAAIRDKRRGYQVEFMEFAHADRSGNAERALLDSERFGLARRMLEACPPVDRNILARFYLLKQPSTQICSEMNLSCTQYRLLKCRAKARLAERYLQARRHVGAGVGRHQRGNSGPG